MFSSLFVCLFVCERLCAETSERICVKFSRKVGSGAMNKLLNFDGSDPDHVNRSCGRGQCALIFS